MSADIELRIRLLKKALEKSGETMTSFLNNRLKQENLPEARKQEILAATRNIPDEMVIGLLASLPKKAFQLVLANVSNVVVPTKEVDPKVRVKAWFESQGIDVRSALEELLRDVRKKFPAYDTDPEYDRLRLLAAEGSDDAVRQWFVDCQDEETLRRMSTEASFYDLFLQEPDPAEALEEQLLGEIMRRNDHDAKVSDLLGTGHLKVRDVFGETEEELIDQLNRLEYKRDEPAHGSPAAKMLLVGVIPDALERDIRNLTARLTTIQEGKIDRFKLRGFSVVQLEHLTESTQQEINELETMNSDTRSAANKLAGHFKAPPGLVDLLVPNAYGYELYIKKRLASALKFRLKQMAATPDTPQERAARIADEVREMNETITNLERRCADEVNKHPSQEDAIRRRFRKAIDSVKDQA